nr:immunoglobulin heavy chain junction region [Macaca mulatta]
CARHDYGNYWSGLDSW